MIKGSARRTSEIFHAAWGASADLRAATDPEAAILQLSAMLLWKHASDASNAEAIKPQSPGVSAPFTVPPAAHFERVYATRQEPGLATRIEAALATLTDANQPRLNKVLEQARFQGTDKSEETAPLDQALERLLDGLAAQCLADAGFALGNAFVDLLDQFATTYKTLGDFALPQGLLDLLFELLEPAPTDSVYDPACGSGGTMAAILQYRDGQNPPTPQVYGEEANPAKWALAKTSLFLHGINDPRIEHCDAIREPRFIEAEGQLRQFDVVLSKPPFGVADWGYELAERDPFGRYQWGVPPKTRGDYAYILHMLASLKPTGRMGVVVPHGILFRSLSEATIRQRIIEENVLDAVIGLPRKLLYDTANPLAVMVFKKERPNRDVLFVDGSKLYIQYKNQNTLDHDQVGKIARLYQEKMPSGISRLVSYEEIRANDYNLNISRYTGVEFEVELDFATLLDERKQLTSKLQQLQTEISDCLEALNQGVFSARSPNKPISPDKRK